MEVIADGYVCFWGGESDENVLKLMSAQLANVLKGTALCT